MADWSAIVSTAIPFVFGVIVLLCTCQHSRCALPLACTNRCAPVSLTICSCWQPDRPCMRKARANSHRSELNSPGHHKAVLQRLNSPVSPAQIRIKTGHVLSRLYKDKAERVNLAGWAWHDANDLSTSPWFGSKGAQVVLGYRCFLLLTFLFVIIWEFTKGGSTAGWGTYFTNWTFVGMAVHAVVGIVQSVRGIRRGSRRSSAVGWKWLPYDWFDKLHSGIGSSIISISLHVAIFYWAALNPGSIKLDSAFKHGINAFLLQIELWISSFPLTSTWVVFPLAYTLIYAIYMWIWNAAEDSWVYNRLNYEKSLAPAAYLAVSVLVLFTFGICWLGAWIREKAAARFLLAKSSVEHDPNTDKADQPADVEMGGIPH